MFDDYSLIKIRNRLADEGEELVVHRFGGGIARMVARADFEYWLRRASTVEEEQSRGLWESIKNYFTGFLTYYGSVDKVRTAGDEPGPVVAIPPEALLRVFDVPAAWQEQYQLAACEDALFLELPQPIFRCGLCFGNGIIVPLGMLPEGQKIKVLRRSWIESLEPELIQVRS